MSILKHKIHFSNGASNPDIIPETHTKKRVPTKKLKSRPKKKSNTRNGSKKKKRPSPETLSVKNISKNFGRAICCFINSSLADDYIFYLHGKWPLNTSLFKNYINDKRDELNSLDSYKDLLVIKGNEGEESKNFKYMFKALAIIFIKYFSVNWIFSGRSCYKQELLKARFQILKRIKNPENYVSMIDK